jgi:hypothetical protein
MHARWALRYKQVSHLSPAGIQCGISKYLLIHALRMLEIRVLRKVTGPEGKKVAGKWRKLDRKDLYDSYSAPDIIRVVKSRGKRDG